MQVKVNRKRGKLGGGLETEKIARRLDRNRKTGGRSWVRNRKIWIEGGRKTDKDWNKVLRNR